jgi:hypothetical protein
VPLFGMEAMSDPSLLFAEWRAWVESSSQSSI